MRAGVDLGGWKMSNGSLSLQRFTLLYNGHLTLSSVAAPKDLLLQTNTHTITLRYTQDVRCTISPATHFVTYTPRKLCLFGSHVIDGGSLVTSWYTNIVHNNFRNLSVDATKFSCCYYTPHLTCIMELHSRPLSRCKETNSSGFNTEEDSGYHSDSSVAGDLWRSTKTSNIEPEVSLKNEVTKDSMNGGRQEVSEDIKISINIEGKSEWSGINIQNTKVPKETQPNNPFMTKGQHGDLWCCTNGHFRVLSGPFSEFESNCSCTSRTLVDWNTRPVWSSLHLRHQYKIREVTHLSPYRTRPRVFPAPLVHHYRHLNQVEPIPTSYNNCHPRIVSTLAFPSRESTHNVYLRHHTSRESTPVVHNILPQCHRSDDLYIQGKEETHTGTSVNIKQEASEASQHSEVSEARPYMCEEAECGRTFCRNEELTRHLRIHSGHRPFKCQECGRGFVRRDHLTKHLRTHLPSHAKRTYTCPLHACPHRYTRSDALTRHMWTAHHIRARQPPRHHNTRSRTTTPCTSSSPRTTTPMTTPVVSQSSLRPPFCPSVDQKKIPVLTDSSPTPSDFSSSHTDSSPKPTDSSPEPSNSSPDPTDSFLEQQQVLVSNSPT
ncbi:hypothetical protein Pmani_035036 [Petrolisthes manimaculis]|uniref:C2H2-type domain-containing protein n=1 Tax=Petrolisthes manimaculis TaxID=1843537 RepID=A0AAE1NNS7_9EUCA|nr:hypothetical protein Pmani_035036 [Petrolisthes manimaculis]